MTQPLISIDEAYAKSLSEAVKDVIEHENLLDAKLDSINILVTFTKIIDRKLDLRQRIKANQQ